MKDQQQKMKMDRVPIDKPPFTLTQIKKSIPPHCFNRSIPRSSFYLILDISISALLIYFAHCVLIPRHNLDLFTVIAWPLYWICQGLAFTAIWTIGHDCGHHAFSEYTLLDDIIGFVIHTAMLIPYFSFKISHRRHHNYNAHLEQDQIFVPKRMSQLSLLQKIRLIDNSQVSIVSLATHLALGWPLYLIFNTFGQSYKSFASHFYPYSPMYSSNERGQVLISDIGVVTVLYFLYNLGTKYGIWWLVLVYVIPQLVLSACVVTLSFLSHTHQAIPRFDSSEWDFLHGALATVDRDLGWFSEVIHKTTNGHIVHHLFPRIPHYHLKDATNAIIPLLGKYYKFDSTPVHKAIWREMKECVYVESDDVKSGIFWFNH